MTTKAPSPTGGLRKELYTFECPWPVYALGWSSRGGNKALQYRLAIGSFIEQYSNKVEIIRYRADQDTFVRTASFDHPYPATKVRVAPLDDSHTCVHAQVCWMPDEVGTAQDLVATSGDFLRVWKVSEHIEGSYEDTVELKVHFTNTKNSEFCAPLTSMDWNRDDPTMIATSSIDTTCTIWNVQTGQAKTQLIAHDEEVYDIAFARGRDRFATAGADGSVRMFDLRELEHSTIIYESAKKVPSLRVAWNEQDPNFLAAIEAEASFTTIIDIRMPAAPVTRLGGHSAPVTAIAWAPHSSCHMCSAGDDAQALIWSLSSLPKQVDDPILAYNASSEINNLKWSHTNQETIAIAFDKKIQVLQV